MLCNVYVSSRGKKWIFVFLILVGRCRRKSWWTETTYFQHLNFNSAFAESCFSYIPGCQTRSLYGWQFILATALVILLLKRWEKWKHINFAFVSFAFWLRIKFRQRPQRNTVSLGTALVATSRPNKRPYWKILLRDSSWHLRATASYRKKEKKY
jgi:hypothetical protein